MGIRQRIEEKPAATVSVVVATVIGALIWTVYTLRPEKPAALTKAYFTDDDGKTTFVDKITQIPPFDHNGKPAVRALLFTIDDHATSFVGYLERYKPEAIKQLQASRDAVAAGKPTTVNASMPAIAMNGTEFKKPGDAKWLPGTDLRAKQELIKDFTPSGKVLDSVVP